MLKNSGTDVEDRKSQKAQTFRDEMMISHIKNIVDGINGRL